MDFLFTFIFIAMVGVAIYFVNAYYRNDKKVLEDSLQESLADPKFKNAKQYRLYFPHKKWDAGYFLITEKGDCCFYYVNPPKKVFNIKEIASYKVNIDGNEVSGLKNAVVGGALFGPAGAVVGALNKKEYIESVRIVFTFNDFNTDQLFMSIFFGKAPKGSLDYTIAIDTLEAITASLDLVKNNLD